MVSLGLTTVARAADVGSITGSVTDKRTNHAIPFASVGLVGQKRGGMTDSEGHYTISGVPPGTYELKVQFLGYKPGGSTSVVVVAGKATVFNVALEENVVREEKTVEVTAERRLVEARQGATVRSVNSRDIRNMPVTTVGDVMQRQAGISTDAEQIHVRGGRADETIFNINGVTNRDLVTGQSTAGSLNARSVEAMDVNTGALDVRYGQALSGVVDIRLKEGRDKFEGGITTTTGSYGGRSWQVLVSGPDPVWQRGLRAIGVKVPGTVSSILDLSGSLFETRFRYMNTPNASLFDRTIYPPSWPRLKSGYEDSFFGYKFKYPDMWSPSADNRWSGRYGITWKPNSRDKLNYSFSKRIAIDQGFSRSSISASGDQIDPSYPWQWDHRISNAPTIFEDNVQTSMQWRRTLSASGYTEFNVSRYFFAQRTDVNGKHWSEYEEPDDRSAFPVGDPRRDDYFIDTGDGDTWQDRRSTSWSMSWNLTQRVMRRHEIEVGFEHQFQSVQYLTIERPWVYDQDGLGASHDVWMAHPWVGDMYLRDKLEFEGFTANVGLRADYWFVGREAENALADTSRANIATSTRNQFYSDTRSFFGRRYKLHISPRIEVAHPITEYSSFFFNYGEFTQNPSYRYVYSKLNSISSESFPLQGNPNLNPQVSVSYEVGAKHQFHPKAAANISFFVKDVYDYPASTRVDPVEGTNLASYFIYLNGHFSRSKGFEVEVEKRVSNHWSGKLSYSYQQTKGKSSDPNEDRVLQEIGGSSETRLSETFVRWNRPHKISASADVRFDKETPPTLRFLKQSGLNLFMQGSSGRAYTPYSATGDRTVGEPYSENAPVQITTDVRFNRWFKVGTRKLDISLQGTNIFSNRLIYRVDSITGRGYVWGQGQFDPNNVTRTLNDYTYISTLLDPSNYGPGAQWRLTLDVDF
ncbi:MAG: TonB-dependent receptor [Candidatus Eisenbacteria bacterium]